MSYKLLKPYSERQKNNFIVEFNHNKNLKIEETSTALYALCEDEILENGEIIKNPDYEEQIKAKEREKLDKLFLTGSDVERAIYKSKGMDFDDIFEFVKDLKEKSENPQSSEDFKINENEEIFTVLKNIDLKALKIELKANNFYRGNPYINQIGALLGYSIDELDYLFLNKELSETIEGSGQAEQPEEMREDEGNNTSEIDDLLDEDEIPF